MFSCSRVAVGHAKRIRRKVRHTRKLWSPPTNQEHKHTPPKQTCKVEYGCALLRLGVTTWWRVEECVGA